MKWIDSTNEGLISATEWTAKNFKAISIILTLVIVIGAVWASISYSQESKASKALTAYAPIERDFTAWKTPPEKTDSKKEAAKSGTAQAVTKIDPVQLYSRMLDYIKSQGDVPANELMALMAAEVAAVLGPEKEAELLEVTKKTFKNGSQLMDGLLLIKNGDLFANQDKCDLALDQWKKVTANNRLTYLHDLARLKSGLCFEKMAKFKEAEQIYDQVIQDSKKNNEAQKTAQNVRQNQWAVKEAQKLKRALKWSQKQQPST